MKKLLMIAAVLAAFGLLLAGCGGDNGGQVSDNGGGGGSNPTAAPTSVPTEAPVDNLIDDRNYRNEEFSKINFNVEVTWIGELIYDDTMYYYPDVENPPGYIECAFIDIPIGSVDKHEAEMWLDELMDGLMVGVDNPEDTGRIHYKIGDNYAIRAIIYSDLSNNNINDDTQVVSDVILVLFEEGVVLLSAHFSLTDYENMYKNIIETTFTSVQINTNAMLSDSTSGYDSGKVAVEWVEFLREYEAWVDAYIVFMEKYKANPTDLSLMMDYLDMLQKMIDWAEKADEINNDLTGNDSKEYLETLTRIIAKLTAASL